MYELINISKSFGDKKVLNNVNLHIYKGEVLSIIGKNGSGKTTLIKLLTKLLLPDSGCIKYKNMNLDTYGNDLYKDIGVMLEGNRNVYWYMTGMQNVEYFGGLCGLNKKEIHKSAEELFELFDLKGNEDIQVGDYSRGMKQKLSLIISLINDPDIIFLDEPTLGLDIFTKKFLVKKIKELSKLKNKTIIVSSHELGVVEEISDRIIIINDNETRIISDVRKFIEIESGLRKSYSIMFAHKDPSFILDDLIKRISIEVLIQSDLNVKFKIVINKPNDLNEVLNIILNNQGIVEEVEFVGINLEDAIKEYLSDEI